jgi:methionine biosynthesis protein MetW
MRELKIAEKVYQNAGNEEVIRWVPIEAAFILDIGCGAGDVARRLARTGRQIDGITMSAEELHIAKHHCRSVYLHDVESGLPLVGDNAYDVVIASHVLEHLRYPAPVLTCVNRTLKVSGRFIVVLPNMLHWRNRMKLLFGKVEYETQGLMDDTHFKWYTFDSGRHLLESYGFKVIHAYVTGYVPLGATRKLCPRRLNAWMEHIALTRLPGVFGTQLIYICAK